MNTVNFKNIAIIGASGAIGQALVTELRNTTGARSVLALARNPDRIENATHTHAIDITDEASVEKAATWTREHAPLDMVFVATGILHTDTISPEKSWRALDIDAMAEVFAINTIGPSMVAKHFLPLLHTDKPALFAALSARVGSIGDNGLGGWYSYRASKAALNMVIKTLSIEVARKNKAAIIAGLHPGTVNSELSKPFQSHVPEGKLFTPQRAASALLKVMTGLTAADTGKCFDWAGEYIEP